MQALEILWVKLLQPSFDIRYLEAPLTFGPSKPSGLIPNRGRVGASCMHPQSFIQHGGIGCLGTDATKDTDARSGLRDAATGQLTGGPGCPVCFLLWGEALFVGAPRRHRPVSCASPPCLGDVLGKGLARSVRDYRYFSQADALARKRELLVFVFTLNTAALLACLSRVLREAAHTFAGDAATFKVIHDVVVGDAGGGLSARGAAGGGATVHRACDQGRPVLARARLYRRPRLVPRRSTIL